jgi:hypothetical protein
MRKNKYAKVKLCRKVNMKITSDVTFRRRFGDLGPSNRTFWLDHALEGVSEGTESSPAFSSSICTWVSGELGDSDSSCAGVLSGVISFFLHTFLVFGFSSCGSLTRNFFSSFVSTAASPLTTSFFWLAPSSLMACYLRRWERRLLFLFFLGFS